MIKAVNNIEEVVKLFRAELLAQSELSSEKVLNGFGFRGANPRKNISNDIYAAYNQMNGAFIIFTYAEEDEQGTERIIQENNEFEMVYTSIKFHLMIYGNNAGTLSQKIRARLLTEESRDRLYGKGLHLQTISNIESGTDFINETMWQRRDMYVEIACRLNISKVTVDNSYIQTDITEIDIE